MEQLSALQLEKQAAEESLATQLAMAKEELMTEKAKFERLKRELDVAKDKLSKSKTIYPWVLASGHSRSNVQERIIFQWNKHLLVQ